MRSSPAIHLACAALLLAACGSEPKTPKQPEEGVAVNSMAETQKEHEAKLRAAEAEAAATPVATVSNEPVRGVVPPPRTSPTPSSAPPAGLESEGKTASAGARATVSKAQCAQLFDRYIDLAVGADARLGDLGPELKGIIQQAKAQARAQKDDPCETEEVSRAKYDCGMNAKTTDAWQACMK